MKHGHLVRSVCWIVSCAVGLSLLYVILFEVVLFEDIERERSCDPESLTVMTWNIGYAKLRNNAAKDRDMPHVAAVIDRFGPDIVVLQEQATAGQLELLLDELNGQYSGKTSAAPRGSRGVSILSRLPVDRWDTFRTSMGWGGMLIDVRSRKLDRTFCVMGCYAPAGRRSKLRSQYCRDIIDIALNRNLPVFIAGDFNMDPGHVFDRFLPFFTDNRNTDLQTYRLMVDLVRDCAIDAGSTCMGRRRIDYVFALPKDIRIESARVIRGQRLFGMDHSPLLVTVREEDL